MENDKIQLDMLKSLITSSFKFAELSLESFTYGKHVSDCDCILSAQFLSISQNEISKTKIYYANNIQMEHHHIELYFSVHNHFVQDLTDVIKSLDPDVTYAEKSLENLRDQKDQVTAFIDYYHKVIK
ncbi:hypothetical protein DH09_02375 [Bacillaceae bacterium JMAK1]|nr:hypothetical protein DH09_02375 [Bacillaceae bacterium JMAK1]